MRARVFDIVLFKLLKFLHTDAVATCVNPFLAFIAFHEVVRGVVLVCLHTDRTVVAILIQNVTVGAYSFEVISRIITPNIPESF